MILAHIINVCEDELICDLAETYHILNYRELPPNLVAVFSLGLRDNSRVKLHFSNSEITLEQAILAKISDSLDFVAWSKTRDAQKGRRYKGKSLLKELANRKEKDEYMQFDTPEEFEQYMKQFER